MDPVTTIGPGELQPLPDGLLLLESYVADIKARFESADDDADPNELRILMEFITKRRARHEKLQRLLVMYLPSDDDSR